MTTKVFQHTRVQPQIKKSGKICSGTGKGPLLGEPQSSSSNLASSNNLGSKLQLPNEELKLFTGHSGPVVPGLNLMMDLLNPVRGYGDCHVNGVEENSKNYH